jgi:uncharacterized protein YbjQ (UPF0145 family)
MKTVFKVRVVTKDVISDTLARLRSIIGGRVKTYERVIQQALEEAYDELKAEYPNVKNIRFGTTEMIKDGAEIVVYGEVDE